MSRPGDDRVALTLDRDRGHQPTAAAGVAGSGARRRAAGPARATAAARAGPNGATSAPSSVTIAEMRSAGVTSNAGFQTVAPGGATARRRNCEQLGRRTLLDRDAGAVERLEVDRAERRADVERDAMAGGQRRQRVGPDLVGRVAVGRDPVGPDEDGVDRARGEQRTGRGVGDHRVGHAGLLELPGRQPRSPGGSGRVSSTWTWMSRPAPTAAWTTPSAVPNWPQASGPVLQWVSTRTGRSSGFGRSARPCSARSPWSWVASAQIASASAHRAAAMIDPVVVERARRPPSGPASGRPPSRG